MGNSLFVYSFYRAFATLGGNPGEVLASFPLATEVVSGLAVFERALPRVAEPLGNQFSACMDQARRGDFSRHGDMVSIVNAVDSAEKRKIANMIRQSDQITADLFRDGIDPDLLNQSRRAIAGTADDSSPIVSLEEAVRLRAAKLRKAASNAVKEGRFEEAANHLNALAVEESRRVRHFREARDAEGMTESLSRVGFALEEAGDALYEAIDSDLETILKFGEKVGEWIKIYEKMDALYAEGILRFRLSHALLQEALLLEKRGRCLMGLAMMHEGSGDIQKAAQTYLTAFKELAKARHVFGIIGKEEPPALSGNIQYVQDRIPPSSVSKFNPANDRAREIVDFIVRINGRIVVLTGAGISAESGIPTFRDTPVVWKDPKDPQAGDLNILDILTRETLNKNPGRFWRFIRFAIERLKAAAPNSGHEALAILEKKSGVSVTAITQNVDDFHLRAGSTRVLGIHGNLFRFRCTQSGCDFETEEYPESSEEVPPCPRCGAHLRPDIVLFEEQLDTDLWSRSEAATREADLLLVVGTSGRVWPAANLVPLARESGAFAIQVNLEPTEASNDVHIFLEGSAGKILPEILPGF